jgi:hypothetical protein
MSLVKKTIVLSKEKAKGYLTLVRIGETSGAKLILSEPPAAEKMWLALKIGTKPQFNAPFSGDKAEFSFDLDFGVGDNIGVVICDNSSSVFATGGRRDMVNMTELKKFIEGSAVKKEQPKESYKEQLKKPEIKREFTIKPEDIKQAFAPEPEKKTSPFNIPKGVKFYQSVRSRLDEIMTINPREEALEKVIPDSKWVKIRYDGEDYYVVGVLSDEGVTTHIAYGVPGLESVKPPKEAEELCDFLPLPEGNGKGYWIMFQDATNGSIIKN